MSKEKFERFCKVLNLIRGARVIDIACGKGEYLVRFAELYDISGVGVDKSPFCIRDCKEKLNTRMPEANLEFLEMDGADYRPDSPESFDLAMCLGASWVFGGHRGTLRALNGMTKPGGLIVAGEPYWLGEPSEDYLQASGMKRADYLTHHENVLVGEEEGLKCVYTIVSDVNDWDHYETLQLWAIDDHVRSNPEDPDNAELLKRGASQREQYLKWGRDTLNWAIYVFRKPTSRP
ncbi:MAG: SAM-dependent methyltransferase [Candidatus Thorarchaeota archaeon]